MFPEPTPTKRKNENQQDGNAIWEEDDDIPSCSSKRSRRESASNNTPTYPVDLQKNEDQRLDRVREIVSREFSREIKSKEAQLEQADDRLEDAKNLLERLRYAIVAEYYKKQEQAQTMMNAAAAMRLENAEKSSREKMQQIPLHPSLKKIIGKRPQSLAEILRACPKREAAKNAKHVLSTKSAAERREERRLQKVIREKGLVIDHSKQNIKLEPSSPSLNENATQTKPKESVEDLSNRLESPNPHVLNNMRTSNKLKCHFVVGNTSKYIGKSEEAGSNTSFSHKWLVYVQTKDTEMPVEKYVKKVRFFLHPSYRPNDVVDIHEPPFQVARRGWGEFPMRIQLFFHESFRQKPLQLVHKVVLDTIKSGRHTLGAETVVEVWLHNEADSMDIRESVKKIDTTTVNLAISSPAATISSPLTPDFKKKPRTISFNIKETFDDNFFDFLNKIEESRTSICADIEKIEPTLLVNEPLEPQFSNTIRSPIKNEMLRSPYNSVSSQLSPLKNISTRLTPQNVQTTKKHNTLTNSLTLPKSIKEAANKLSAVINQNETESNGVPNSKQTSDPTLLVEPQSIATINPNIILSHTSIQSSQNQTPKNFSEVVTSSKTPKIISVNDINTKALTSGKVFNNASGTVILPITKKEFPSQQLKPNSTIQMQPNFPNKALFQRKTIQVVNAQGQIKTVQMLIASSKSLPGTVAKKPLTSSSETQIISLNALNTQTSTATTDPTKTSHTNCLTQEELLKSKPDVKTSIKSVKMDDSSSTLPNNAINAVRPLTASGSKNIVFQKEGKLFIIDPIQIKLKQQRKHQVSLLKPQVKKQTEQKNLTLQSVASDHDYAPPPNSESTRLHYIQTHENRNYFSVRAPQIHFGMRETRLSAIKAQDHQNWQRIQLERKLNNTEFSNMREAVEYLLRRVPLIVNDKESPAIAFPFVRATPQEFQFLPAFKQRSFEWLRAKFIEGVLRNSKALQTLHASKVESFWSTREIATFARFYGYTPPMKALQQIEEDLSDSETTPGSKEHFAAVIKTEMKSMELQLEYDSLSPSSHVIHWVKNMMQKLELDSQTLSTEEVITIDDDNECGTTEKITSKEQATSEAIITKRIYGSPLKFQGDRSNLFYLPPTERLETAFHYVGDICKDISIRLNPEEILPGIVHPSAQTILAHISQLFIERLLRQVVANQTLHEQEQHSFGSRLPHNNLERNISLQDIRKAISQCAEYDFLTNRYMGVASQRIKREQN